MLLGARGVGDAGRMFGNQIRAAALSLCAAIQWVANFAVSTSFPPLLKGLGLWAAYALYAFLP